MGTGPMNLSGKTAIITAGAGGIGLAIARRFVEYGASICICDISEESLAEAAEIAQLIRAGGKVNPSSHVELRRQSRWP